MELVINISEQEYNECKNLFNMIHQEGYINYNLNTSLVMYIANGTPLEEALKNYWICVSDRLPNKDGYYDVIDKRGGKCKYVFNTQGNSKEYWLRCALLWNPSSYKERE